jgi:Ras-related protein Rab-1A
MANYDYIFKVLIIGDASVGKTCLLHRYARGTFSESYLSTIGVDFVLKQVEVDECPRSTEEAGKTGNGRKAKVKLQVWDTAGQERFKNITLAYYRGATGIILMYDRSNRKSFENLKMWLGEIQRYTFDSIPVVLVANKCDLTSFVDDQVADEEGAAFAQQQSLQFFVTSNKLSRNIIPVFDSLTCSMIKRQLAGQVPAIQQSSKMYPVYGSDPLVEKKSKCC